MPILSKTDHDTAPDHYVDVLNMGDLFIKELARSHDALTKCGSWNSEQNNELSEMGDEEWHDGPNRVLAIIEGILEPGNDLILIYNWEGVLRMTGIQTCSHGTMHIYRTNESKKLKESLGKLPVTHKLKVAVS